MNCPACHADLTGTTLAGDWCPFCGEEFALPATDADDRLEERTIASGSTSTTTLADGLPAGSKVEIVEDTDDQFVLHLPPGGKSMGGIGCFALMWNGFMLIFTPPWFFAKGNGGGPPMFFIIPFLLLFWAIGIGFIVAWVRMKKTRTYMLATPDRLVIQKQLFGRKSMEEVDLAGDQSHGMSGGDSPGVSRFGGAKLVESYSVNDVPVHAVVVAGSNRTVKFGTRLSEEEKSWVVERLNQFWQVGSENEAQWSGRQCPECNAYLVTLKTDARFCPECGKSLPESWIVPLMSIPEITPSKLDGSSDIIVDQETGEALQFHLPAVAKGSLRTWASNILMIGGLVWSGIAIYHLLDALAGRQLDAFAIFGMVFQFLFTLPGLVMFLAGLFVQQGRITIAIDPEWFCVRWHFGKLGYTKRYMTSSIERVQLLTAVAEKGEKGRPALEDTASDESVVATVHVGKSFVAMTTNHSQHIARTVAGLVKTHLELLDVDLVSS